MHTENPHAWPLAQKLFHTFTPASVAFLAGFGNTIYVLGIGQVQAEFHVSTTISLLPYSLYTFGIALGPVIAAPLSESYGRKVVYSLSLPCFALSILGAALSKNIAILSVCQLLAGFSASPGLSVGTGMIADVWPSSSRATPMAVYLAAPFCGPAFGAVAGGIVVQARGWRWTLWTVLILTATIYPLILLTHETYERTITLRRHKHITAANLPKPSDKSSTMQATKTFLSGNFIRPLHMLFGEPIVAAFAIYLLFILASFFLMIAAVPYVFYTIYGFEIRSQGLVFLSFVTGFLLASATFIQVSHLIEKKMNKNSAPSTPESRLALARLTSIILPASLFWFGWSAQIHAPWISPVLAVGLLAVNIFLLFVPCSLYVVDCYGPRHAASAIAATRIAGYLGGVAFPLFTTQMYSSLTVGWASTLLALVALVLAPIPWGFARYGSKLRATTKYGPTYSQHQPPPNQYLREFLLGAPRSKFEDPRPAPQPPRPVKFRPRLARQIAFDR